MRPKDFLFLRSGLELAEQEVRGDIAKTRKEAFRVHSGIGFSEKASSTACSRMQG